MNKILNVLAIVTCIYIATTTGQYALANDNQDNDAPIVVELFTSQGCPSCPPADKILQKLTKKDNIIALACHVSYWDKPQWKDRFAQEFCDIRQHGYISMDDQKRVYTPQMVINGKDKFIGSRADNVKYTLKKASESPLKIIEVETPEPDVIRIALPILPDDNYHLWAFGYKKTQKQNIGNGENSGKTIYYANPVISYTNLGAWRGAGMVYNFRKPKEPIDGIAILAQRLAYGEIVAAGKMSFSKN